MAHTLYSPENVYRFPEDQTAAYGLFFLTQLNQLGEKIFKIEDETHYSGKIDWIVRKAVREWETDAGGTDRVIVNRRGDEIFRASTLLLSPKMPAMLDLMMKKHENQVRKGDGADYREHPLEVSHLLREYGFHADIISAGFGHDLLEDTDATEEEILQASSAETLRLIKAMTQPESGSWHDKKIHHINQIQDAGIRAAAVFAADHIANLRSMVAGYTEMGKTFWENFNMGKEGRLWYELTGFEVVRKLLPNHPITDHLGYHVQEFRQLAKK